jgi:hypothetical protein
MRAFLESFVVRHENDVAKEGRWRAKMSKRITLQFQEIADLQLKTMLAAVAVQDRGDATDAVRHSLEEELKSSSGRGTDGVTRAAHLLISQGIDLLQGGQPLEFPGGATR